MSPDIRSDGRLIASVPDETGMHQTLSGEPLYVNVDNIDADADTKSQKVILESAEIGGRREVGLTLEGVGNSSDHKRGDKKSPVLEVKLLDKPIRVTYSKRVGDGYSGWGGREPRRTIKNPRWVKDQERG